MLSRVKTLLLRFVVDLLDNKSYKAEYNILARQDVVDVSSAFDFNVDLLYNSFRLCCKLSRFVVQFVVQRAVQQIYNKSKQVELGPNEGHHATLTIKPTLSVFTASVIAGGIGGTSFGSTVYTQV